VILIRVTVHQAMPPQEPMHLDHREQIMIQQTLIRKIVELDQEEQA
jgi:hypothetical protein